MTILITGAHGMLGSAFSQMQMLEDQGHTILYTDRETFDITQPSQMSSFFATHSIDCVINCAAYTSVDQAEEDLLNYELNTLALTYLANICEQHKTKLIHISTDYVFNGTQQGGYLTTDPVGPLNAYGLAKRLGEQIVLRSCSQSKVVRTSRLYGGGKDFKNFVNTMLRLAETKTELSIINDQQGAPTYTNDLVEAIVILISNREACQQKIYHFCNKTNQGGITRFDFAQEVFSLTNKSIALHPISSDQYPSKAIRPQYGWMINDSNIQLPDWKISLDQYISQCERES